MHEDEIQSAIESAVDDVMVLRIDSRLHAIEGRLDDVERRLGALQALIDRG